MVTAHSVGHAKEFQNDIEGSRRWFAGFLDLCADSREHAEYRPVRPSMPCTRAGWSSGTLSHSSDSTSFWRWCWCWCCVQSLKGLDRYRAWLSEYHSPVPHCTPERTTSDESQVASGVDVLSPEGLRFPREVLQVDEYWARLAQLKEEFVPLAISHFQVLDSCAGHFVCLLCISSRPRDG
jgi:hypothetical protein